MLIRPRRACDPFLPRARSPLTSETEASDLIAAATLPTKRQHKAQLEAALREIEQENASLQEQYLAAQPALQPARHIRTSSPQMSTTDNSAPRPAVALRTRRQRRRQDILHLQLQLRLCQLGCSLSLRLCSS